MQNIKPFKGIAHIHIYYENQLNYFVRVLKILKKFNCDIFITHACLSSRALKKLAFYTDNIYKIENRGFDVFPFLEILNKIDLNNYFWLLKLHTKGSRNCIIELLGKKYYGYGWRNLLVESLISDEKTFKENVETLKNNLQIGIIAAKDLIMTPLREPEDKKESIIKDVKQTCQFLGFEFDENVGYPSGTMFLARAELFKILKEMKLDKEFFNDKNEKSVMTISKAASIERIIGYLAKQNKTILYGVFHKRVVFKETLKAFIAELSLTKIFSIKNRYKKQNKYKVITILGFEIKFRTEKHDK